MTGLDRHYTIVRTGPRRIGIVEIPNEPAPTPEFMNGSMA